MGPEMAKSPPSNFAHKQNPDGAYHSICKECFKTVATEDLEADLQKGEVSHICRGLNLGDVLRPFDRK